MGAIGAGWRLQFGETGLNLRHLRQAIAAYFQTQFQLYTEPLDAGLAMSFGKRTHRAGILQQGRLKRIEVRQRIPFLPRVQAGFWRVAADFCAQPWVSAEDCPSGE